MGHTLIKKYFIAFILIVITGSVNYVNAQDLGQVLNETEWDKMLGTWIDAETKGEITTVTYSWKIKNKVLEIYNREKNDKETVSLVSLIPDKDEIIHFGCDNLGNAIFAKWEFEKEEAVIVLEEIDLRIRHRFLDKNTMIVTVETDEPINLKLHRVMN